MNTHERNLKSEDLAVGQKLILSSSAGGNWGGKINRTEKVLTITKITKTRLVCTDEAGRDYRFIIEYSAKYTWRNGEVTADLEGSRSRDAVFYDRAHRVLYTTDDYQLAVDRARVSDRNNAVDAENAARKALDDFKKSLSVENATAAIEALQAFIATKEN